MQTFPSSFIAYLALPAVVRHGDPEERSDNDDALEEMDVFFP
jgi:hypothetical protein